jgi:GTP cyclohydrolase I
MADDIAVNWHSEREILNVYPVPRGGVPVAYALKQILAISIVDTPEEADIIVDDLVDSGATRDALKDRTNRGAGSAHSFYALIDKASLPNNHPYKTWLVFPWEVTANGEDASVTDNVVRLLQHIGEDPTREGLLETPKRFLKAWNEWASGYAQDPTTILKTFADGATDEMVIERGIPFFSHCEHHLAPFFGTVDIGYVPNGKIVGLSKMNRLVECFSRRLQVQERLTGQIADAMFEGLDAKGVGVVVRAQHMCVMSRGIRHAGCDTVTSAMRGCFMEGLPRAEFMTLVK